jgi:hypothetical protein
LPDPLTTNFSERCHDEVLVDLPGLEELIQLLEDVAVFALNSCPP